MRRVVAYGWHTDRYLINIDLVAVEQGYNVVIPKTVNGPRLKNDVFQNFCKICFKKSFIILFSHMPSYIFLHPTLIFLYSTSYILIFHFLYSSYISIMFLYSYSHVYILILFHSSFIFLHPTLIFYLLILYSICYILHIFQLCSCILHLYSTFIFLHNTSFI